MLNNIAVPDSNQSQPSIVANGCTSSESVEVDKSDFQTRYGCLGCRPARLQFLTGARWFLLFTCLSTFFQSMAVNGLIGVTISTIERRFGLASSQSSWIAAAYEIAGAPAVLIIGYFGLVIHRPVWIGTGLIMLGIGFGVYSIPHFAAPPYRYSDAEDFSNLCVQTAWNLSTNSSLPVNDR